MRTGHADKSQLFSQYRTAGADSLRDTLQVSGAALKYARTHGATGPSPRKLPQKAFQSTLDALALLNSRPGVPPVAAATAAPDRPPAIAGKGPPISSSIARSSTNTARVLSLLELAKPDGMALQLANLSSQRVSAALQYSAPLPLPVFISTSANRTMGRHSMAPVLREAADSSAAGRGPPMLSVFVSGETGEESVPVRPPVLLSALTDDHFFGAAGNSVGVAGWRRYKAMAAASHAAGGGPRVTFAAAGAAASDQTGGGAASARGPPSPTNSASSSPRLSARTSGPAAETVPARTALRPSTAPASRASSLLPAPPPSAAHAAPLTLDWTGVPEGKALVVTPSAAVARILAESDAARARGATLRQAVAPAVDALAAATRVTRMLITRDEGPTTRYGAGTGQLLRPDTASDVPLLPRVSSSGAAAGDAGDGTMFFRAPPRKAKEKYVRPTSAAARVQRRRPGSAAPHGAAPRVVRMGRLQLSEDQAEAVLSLQVSAPREAAGMDQAVIREEAYPPTLVGGTLCRRRTQLWPQHTSPSRRTL